MKQRIVITGVGVLASNGKGRKEYWSALKEGQIGYGPITLFDAEGFRVRQAAEVCDFDPRLYMGTKGLRTLDRSTKLLVSAAKLAIEDCGFTVTEENTSSVGVSVGTTLGSLRSISEFDEVTLKAGPRYTNPALFPNTVINSPASQVSIWHKIKGFNVTISTGFTASLDAIQYAYDFLRLGRVKVVFAGGVEEMCLQTFFGFYALEFLSGAKQGSAFINCPFDKRRNGITFGEGACLLAMEVWDHARDRGARPLAEIVSFGTAFDPHRGQKYNPKALGLIKAIEQALEKAEMGISDIDYICANANASQAADKTESVAIKSVFGKQAYKIPVSSIKSMLGECYSVSGALAVGAALGVLEDEVIPPTVNYEILDPECDLNIVSKPVQGAQIKNILITNFGPSGNNTCMIIRKFKI